MGHNCYKDDIMVDETKNVARNFPQFLEFRSKTDKVDELVYLKHKILKRQSEYYSLYLYFWIALNCMLREKLNESTGKIKLGKG